MSRVRLQFLLGIALLAVGAGLLAGASVYRNAFVQRLAGLMDFNDRICRKASVAKGAACPAGCAARPTRTPADRYAVPECRSRLWVATCGKACAPDAGFVRLADGRLAAADRLEVELAEGADSAAFLLRVAEIGASADPSLSGLGRYRLQLPNPAEGRAALERVRGEIGRIDGVARVAYDLE